MTSATNPLVTEMLRLYREGPSVRSIQPAQGRGSEKQSVIFHRSDGSTMRLEVVADSEQYRTWVRANQMLVATAEFSRSVHRIWRD